MCEYENELSQTSIPCYKQPMTKTKCEKFRISDSTYNKLIVFTYKEVDEAIRREAHKQFVIRWNNHIII